MKRVALPEVLTRPALAGTLGNPLAPLALIGSLAVAGLLLQASQPLGHDLGWLLFATGRLLDGADVYGRDVFEWNPPANLYLLSPAVVASRWLDVSVMAAVRLYIALLAGVSLLLSDRILAVGPGPERLGGRRLLLVGAAFGLFVGVEESFGQREHLIAIFMLPEIFLIAALASGARAPRRLAAAAGLGAAIAICIKPQYVIVQLVFEVYLAARRRSLDSWHRPDVLVLAVVGLLYVVSLLWWTPGYVSLILPVALDTYWVYQADLARLIKPRDWLLFPVALLVFPWIRRSRPLLELAFALLVAAACFYAVALIQRTGWRYHLIPFQVSMLLLLSLPFVRGVAALADRLNGRVAPLRPIGRWLSAGGLAVCLLAILLATPTRYGRTWRTGAAWRAGETTGLVAQLESTLREHAAGGAVYALSPSLVNIFPAVNHAGVEWSSRFSAFYLPAAVERQRRGDRQVPARLTARRADEIELFVRDAVVEDLQRRPPSLILIDHVKRRKVFAGVPFDLLEFLLEDPRFAEVWSRYEPIGRVGRFDAAVRR